MLFPLITRPTRVTANSATLIDNIFTNNFNGDNWSAQGVLVTDISDHYPVFHLSGQYVTYAANDYFIMRRYNARNKEEFCTALAHMDWQEVCNLSDTQETTFIINFCKCMMNIFLKWKLRKDIQIESPGCQKHCVILSSLKINFSLCTKKHHRLKMKLLIRIIKIPWTNC